MYIQFYKKRLILRHTKISVVTSTIKKRTPNTVHESNKNDGRVHYMSNLSPNSVEFTHVPFKSRVVHATPDAHFSFESWCDSYPCALGKAPFPLLTHIMCIWAATITGQYWLYYKNQPSRSSACPAALSAVNPFVNKRTLSAKLHWRLSSLHSLLTTTFATSRQTKRCRIH